MQVQQVGAGFEELVEQVRRIAEEGRAGDARDAQRNGAEQRSILVRMPVLQRDHRDLGARLAEHCGVGMKRGRDPASQARGGGGQ
jgi:hypothetical protein